MLRKYLAVVDRKASLNQWNDINYNHVPSKANLKYRDAFLNHDEERRKTYLASLKKVIHLLGLMLILCSFTILFMPIRILMAG